MRTATVILPAFLASALINGDASGVDARDLPWLRAAVDYCAPGHIVSCGDESFFSHSCDLPGFTLGADMLEYTVMYSED